MSISGTPKVIKTPFGALERLNRQTGIKNSSIQCNWLDYNDIMYFGPFMGPYSTAGALKWAPYWLRTDFWVQLMVLGVKPSNLPTLVFW